MKTASEFTKNNNVSKNETYIKTKPSSVVQRTSLVVYSTLAMASRLGLSSLAPQSFTAYSASFSIPGCHLLYCTTSYVVL